MTITDDQVEKFSRLFSGYEKVFGEYEVGNVKSDPGKKITGRAKTIIGEIPQSRWRSHLEGIGRGLGIIPLRVNECCRFGVIDHDDRLVNHDSMVKLVYSSELPLVVCRSKSGGAHLYVFFSEDVQATIVRDRLSEWTAALGLSDKTELFPRQVSRASDQDIGNWINIPYYGANNTVRYCIFNGQALSLGEFLEHAESRKINAACAQKPYFRPQSNPDLFWEGPPCLVALHANGGFPPGTGNSGMFAIGVYLRKRYGDSWTDYMDKYNQQIGHRESVELAGIIKSLQNKERKGGEGYNYPCKNSPINTVCQRRTCVTRQFGVGKDLTNIDLGSVIRYDHPPPDPPLWSFEINGRRVLVDNDTLYSRDQLNRACMAQAGCVPFQLSPAKWIGELDGIVKKAEVVNMPEDSSPTGQLWSRIELFLNQGVPAINREEVTTGKVFHENGWVYFSSMDLFTYLDNKRVSYKSTSAVWQLLRQHKSEKISWTFGKKPKTQTINVWGLPYDKPEELVVESPRFNDELNEF